MTTDVNLDDYLRHATEHAIGGTRWSLERRGGQLVDTDSWADGSGHWLRVHASVPSRPGVEVRYARLLVHRDGPDREPELEAALYSSAFIELVLTELPRREPEGGVVEL